MHEVTCDSKTFYQIEQGIRPFDIQDLNLKFNVGDSITYRDGKSERWFVRRVTYLKELPGANLVILALK